MKTIRFYSLIFFLISLKFYSQGILVSPSTVVCSGQSMTAIGNCTLPLAAGYSWSISPAEATVSMNPLNTQIAINFTNCGQHIIYVQCYDSFSTPLNWNAQISVVAFCTPPPTIQLVSTASSVCAGYNSTITASGGVTYTWTGTSTLSSNYQPSVTAGPGTYTCIGRNGGGCYNYSIITIGLNPPLNITVSQSSATTCVTNNFPAYSKPVILGASGAATYAWLPYNPNAPMQGPSVTVRPSSSTCYTVIGNTSVCSGTNVTCVQVIPQFSHQISPASAIICAGDQINLSITNISSLAVGPPSLFTYMWTEPASSAISISNSLTYSVSAFPQSTTTYTTEVWDSRACVSTPQLITLSVNACTDLQSHSNAITNLKLFPNPVQNKLHIESAGNTDLELELSDPSGKIILNQQVHLNAGSFQSLDLTGFSSGLYFLKIDVKDNQRVYKIIKD